MIFCHSVWKITTCRDKKKITDKIYPNINMFWLFLTGTEFEGAIITLFNVFGNKYHKRQAFLNAFSRKNLPNLMHLLCTIQVCGIFIYILVRHFFHFLRIVHADRVIYYFWQHNVIRPLLSFILEITVSG